MVLLQLSWMNTLAQTSTKVDTSRTYGHHKLQLIAKKIAKGVECDSLLTLSKVRAKNDSITIYNKNQEIFNDGLISNQQDSIITGQTKKLKEYSDKETKTNNRSKANKVLWVIAGVGVLAENIYFAVKSVF